MKHGLRRCQGLCAMVSALRVVAVSVRAGRVGVGRPIILEDMSDFQKLVSIGEGENGEIAGGAVQENGLNNTSVQKEQEHLPIAFNLE